MDDPNFQVVDRERNTYRCLICPRSNVMTDVGRHRQRAAHINNARAVLTSTNQGPTPTIESPQQVPAEEAWVAAQQVAAHEQTIWDDVHGLLDFVDVDEQMAPGLNQTLEDELDLLDPTTRGEDDTIPIASIVDHDNWHAFLDEELEAIEQTGPGVLPNEHTAGSNQPGGGKGPAKGQPWYPFKSQMELVGSLIMGHTHSMMSRSMYTKVRAILTLCDVNLPAWATIQLSRARIRKLLDDQIMYSNSPFGTPMFALNPERIISQNLANPLINKHLDFYPELAKGCDVYKFSQSLKWLKGLSPAHRPQMCEVNKKHFYIMEPVQLFSSAVVIPIFLFICDSKLCARVLDIDETNTTRDGTQLTITIPLNLGFDDARLRSIEVKEFDRLYSDILMADCTRLIDACNHCFIESNGRPNDHQVVSVPNPWRIKAKGRLIRHVPITLYADDTSGNISKQFNKHISFFFTLSGLPPRVSNQEYNCHFLSTSNVASVLEISEQIVHHLNRMAQDGFAAYDCSITQPVLVQSVVLCFLADSPMHAEVTNTPNPGQSNHPCRMCTLSVERKSMIKTMAHVQSYLQVDGHGQERPNPLRDWALTFKRTHALYNIAISNNITQFKTQSTLWGVKDAINTKFVIESRTNPALKTKMEVLDLNYPNRLYNPFLLLEGFDGVLDTPVEILHVVLLGVVKYLARDDIAKLKEKEKSILIGRLNSLDRLSLNIDSIKADYLIKHIKSLVGRHFKIIIQSAPFVLLDLLSPERQEIWIALCKMCALIFQTRISNMDSYLDELTLHIHRFLRLIVQSNAQWVNKPKLHMLLHLPESIRRFGPASLFSTKKFESYNGVLQKASVHSNRLSPSSISNASNEVQQVFAHNPLLQRAMGYDYKSIHSLSYPLDLNIKLTKEDEVAIPEEFDADRNYPHLSQLAGIMVSKHEMLQQGVFVVVERRSKLLVGEIKSIWVKKTPQSSHFYVHLQGFETAHVDEHYQMRSIVRTPNHVVVNTKYIRGTINVQHNCHQFQCPVVSTRATLMEREETRITQPMVKHSDDNHYIINSSSLSNPELH
ncbi:hypothetical protein PCASD_10954 [Puccinia coronata f. sp. avenae]|uniref:Uncharacterized protein n=1 Tax=Puccinia coronata f. sp. avenae TaxID=200324 RepID=A0A2N5TCS5_9BASI|nr:hypothetical protein PCASD_10954 [Puccinia coronata f. sp. avenae]